MQWGGGIQLGLRPGWLQQEGEGADPTSRALEKQRSGRQEDYRSRRGADAGPGAEGWMWPLPLPGAYPLDTGQSKDHFLNKLNTFCAELEQLLWRLTF